MASHACIPRPKGVSRKDLDIGSLGESAVAHHFLALLLPVSKLKPASLGAAAWQKKKKQGATYLRCWVGDKPVDDTT